MLRVGRAWVQGMRYDGTRLCVKIQLSKDHLSTQSRDCMWLLEENGDLL